MTRSLYAIVERRSYYGPRTTARRVLDESGNEIRLPRREALAWIAQREQEIAAYPMLAHNEHSTPTYRIVRAS